VTEFLNHAITVSDLLWAIAYGIMLAAGFVGLAVLAVNRGWIK
jgi:hypothetical protein